MSFLDRFRFDSEEHTAPRNFRELRRLTYRMEPDEPKWLLAASTVIAVVGVLGLWAHTTQTVTKTISPHHTVKVLETVQEPAMAAGAIALAVLGGLSVSWRNRMLSAVLFFLAGMAIGYVPFGSILFRIGGETVGFAVFVWLVLIRQKKTQRELVAAYPDAGPPTRASARSGRSNAGRGRVVNAKSRSTSKSSGRYTPPKNKAVGARKR